MISRALLLCMAASLCPAADLFPVSGTILDTVTNAPMPHAYVRFYRPGSDRPIAGAVTETNGHFAFQLPAGSYLMFAGKREKWEVYGSRSPANALGSAVIVGPGKDTSAVVSHYFPPAAITGRIVDEAGQPAPQVLVQLIQSKVTDGRRTAIVLGWRRTDDLGDYRFDHIAAGANYYLAVTGEPWYADRTLAEPGENHSQPAYQPVYYPDTDDPARAAPIGPKPGEEIHADFRLTTTSNATVTLKYDSPPPLFSGAATLYYDGVAGTSAVQQTRSLVGAPVIPLPENLRRGSTLVFLAVPPGHYNLRVIGTAGGQSYDSSVPVIVNGSDVTTSVEFRRASRIEGTAKLPPDFVQKTPVTIGVRDSISNAAAAVTVRPDGAFTFPAVPPGRFSLFAGTGLFITSAVPSKDGMIEVPEETTVHLVVSLNADTGAVRGIVTQNGHPVEGALVVLVSNAGESNSLGYQTESDGSFAFAAIPPGLYRIVALDNPDIEYKNPKALALYNSGMKELEVKVHATIDLQLPMVTR